MKRISRPIAFLIILSALLVTVTSVCAAKPWKFAVVCDTRGSDTDTPGKSCINAYILKKIAHSIVAEKCDLVIVPGDLVNGWWANGGASYEDQFLSWKKAMAPVYDSGIPVYAVRGNHENGREPDYPPRPPYDAIPNKVLKDTFVKVFGRDNPQNGPEKEKGLTFYVRHKNAFFVGFDQYVNNNKVNLDWFSDILAKEFDRAKTPHIFTYGHNPAFQVNHPDCLAAYPEDRDRFWNLFGAAGGKMYFCGHDHLYNRAAIDDAGNRSVFQVLVGSCGAPFKPWSPPYKNPRIKGKYHNEKDYGYMVVTINDNDVQADWKTWDARGDYTWNTMDTFTYDINPQ